MAAGSDQKESSRSQVKQAQQQRDTPPEENPGTVTFVGKRPLIEHVECGESEPKSEPQEGYRISFVNVAPNCLQMHQFMSRPHFTKLHAVVSRFMNLWHNFNLSLNLEVWRSICLPLWELCGLQLYISDRMELTWRRLIGPLFFHLAN